MPEEWQFLSTVVTCYFPNLEHIMLVKNHLSNTFFVAKEFKSGVNL